jgi:hypothetical protein
MLELLSILFDHYTGSGEKCKSAMPCTADNQSLASSRKLCYDNFINGTSRYISKLKRRYYHAGSI